jgi:uncharacterized protein YqeY
MSLKEQIDGDIKKAMLAKNKDELTALRGIKSLILLAETEKTATADLSDEIEKKLLIKAAKQRKESAEIFQREGREELAKKELIELEVINRYLPKQLSDEEISTELKKIIVSVAGNGLQDIGKVMGVATKQLAGKADGKKISELAKTLLGA